MARVLVYLLPIILSCNSYAAGEPTAFYIEIPSELRRDGLSLKGGSYMAVVEEYPCQIFFYPIKKVAKNEVNHAKRKGLAARFPGICVRETRGEESAQVELLMKNDLAIIYFETPDYQKNQTLLIIVILRKADDVNNKKQSESEHNGRLR